MSMWCSQARSPSACSRSSDARLARARLCLGVERARHYNPRVNESTLARPRPPSDHGRFRAWALALIIATIAVILWGAFVRVTGSGAGCADHWPLCNGVLVPRAPKLATLIELTHRITSSLAGLLSVAVFFYARREFSLGAPARRAATLGLVLMLLEGAIGALLVKAGLVAKNASEARALVVGIHLCNTFLLLGAQVLTYHFARGGAPLKVRGQPARLATLLVLLTLALLLGATGAITALGDTLFPAESLRHGVAQDLTPGAHFLIRLRVWHPLLAVLGGGVIVYLAQSLRSAVESPEVTRWAWLVTGVYVAQLGAGSLNLLLLAPAPIQLTHLFLADLVWISLVMLGAHALAAPADQPILESAAS
ncbi:MAG: cytochrome oxidase assembly protein [Myxococcaceae bacterium]|nr:cytochrome oxidase assembly protein [Myxococcaceae bacterium]